MVPCPLSLRLVQWPPVVAIFKQIRVRVEASGGVGHLNSAPGNDPSVQPHYVFVVVLCFAQIWPVTAQTKELKRSGDRQFRLSRKFELALYLGDTLVF